MIGYSIPCETINVNDFFVSFFKYAYHKITLREVNSE